MAESIVAQAHMHGDRVAVLDAANKLTYKELICWAAALCEEIKTLPDADAPVGIFLPNGAAYVVALLSLLMAGRTSVPFDDSHPQERNRRIINRAGLAAVIVDAETAPLVRAIDPDLRQLLVAAAPGANPRRSTPCPAGAFPHGIFMIMFTSGSSDEPKGVCRSEAQPSSSMGYVPPELALTAEDRVPVLGPLSAAMFLNPALSALSSGAQVGIIDFKRLGLSAARRLLGEFRPSVYIVVPSAFRALFASDDAQTADLTRGVRWVRLGGDQVQHSDVDLYRRRFAETCRLVIAVGTTETGVYALWCTDHTTPLDQQIIPVGYSRPDIELELVGVDGTPVERGELGEIVVTSVLSGVGYWRDEGLTRARFSPSEKRPGMVRYQTGDVGRLLPNGLLQLIGRRDRQLKIRGTTVHPGEIEAVLARCPNVAEVGVVARNGTSGPVLAAYCTPAAGTALAEEQLRRWCRDRLPSPMRPTRFFFPAALPKLANGKLDLVKLAALDAQQVTPTGAAAGNAVPTADPTPAMSELSGLVRQAWIGVLSAESFDADAPFDAAGGDSLKGLELLARLEALLARSLPIGLLTLETRPSELIQRLLKIIEAKPAADEGPFIVLFPGLWGDDVHTSDFYWRLSQRFRIIAVDPRLGGDALAADYRADRYFAAALAAIRSTGSHRRLWLVGFCHGGKLAAETARRLLASGTAVEAVIVLDGDAAAPLLQRLNGAREQQRRELLPRLRSGAAAYGGMGRYFLNGLMARATRLAVTYGAVQTLRSLRTIAVRFGSAETSRYVSRQLVGVTRSLAFGDLPGGVLPMALRLFVTDDPRQDGSAPYLGWSERCREVHKISVGGTHRTMLAPPTRDVVMAELARLETALRPQ